MRHLAPGCATGEEVEQGGLARARRAEYSEQSRRPAAAPTALTAAAPSSHITPL